MHASNLGVFLAYFSVICSISPVASWKSDCSISTVASWKSDLIRANVIIKCSIASWIALGCPCLLFSEGRHSLRSNQQKCLQLPSSLLVLCVAPNPLKEAYEFSAQNDLVKRLCVACGVPCRSICRGESKRPQPCHPRLLQKADCYNPSASAQASFAEIYDDLRVKWLSGAVYPHSRRHVCRKAALSRRHHLQRHEHRLFDGARALVRGPIRSAFVTNKYIDDVRHCERYHRLPSG